METITGTDVLQAADHLRHNRVVAIPTETVYGLAANAFSEAAVLEVFRVKNRPSFDPLIVHVKNKFDALQLAEVIPPKTEALMDRFWPGPLTLVLRKKGVIPDLVTSGLDTFGVRMPDHPVTLQLLQQLDFPLAAPSANPFGYISPTSAIHVSNQLGGKIPYILDGGPCRVGVESTIIGYENDQWQVYRYGGIPAEEILKITGDLLLPDRQHQLIAAPGMLDSHYAPRKPLWLGELGALLKQHSGKRMGWICYRQPDIKIPEGTVVEVLSPSGDPDEAARNLFSAMRRLDASDAEVILAVPVPDTGIGRAVNDRLRRAAHKG